MLPSHSCRRTACFLTIMAALIVANPIYGTDLNAGAATIDITPPVGYPMWGYGSRHDAPSLGILDRLHARAVVLQCGETQLAIVSLDLGRAPTRQSTARIRQQLKRQAKIEHVFLVATHTHHGPVVELDSWPTKEKPYVRQLESNIVSVIRSAQKRLQPARYGTISKEVPWNRNRHSRRRNAPLDRELIVVRIEDHQGKPIAHLVNFAAHPTMHKASIRKFSADYCGTLAKFVEKSTNAPCLFLQAAAGDVSTNAGQTKGAEAFGEKLGMEVVKLAKGIQCTEGKNATLAIRERHFQFRMRFDLSNPIIKTAFSIAFFPDLVEFYAREYRDGVRPTMTIALLDRRIGFVGVSGEFFCNHAIQLKQRARLEHLLFLGYCNDYHQYFPTIEAVAEGGYGADMQVAPVEVGAGEKMMNRALIDLYQMRGRIGNLYEKNTGEK